jgi:hypothetical protein
MSGNTLSIKANRKQALFIGVAFCYWVLEGVLLLAGEWRIKEQFTF